MIITQAVPIMVVFPLAGEERRPPVSLQAKYMTDTAISAMITVSAKTATQQDGAKINKNYLFPVYVLCSVLLFCVMY